MHTLCHFVGSFFDRLEWEKPDDYLPNFVKCRGPVPRLEYLSVLGC
jgi:hypothetical protein